MVAATAEPKRQTLRIGRIVFVLLLFVVCYFGYAVYTGVAPLKAGLARFDWWTFGAAFGLAFGNYVLRFFKWQFYLNRLGVPRSGPGGVGVVDSFLTFLSGFVLTISPGKVGEVFKSLVLNETARRADAEDGPIVVAERVDGPHRDHRAHRHRLAGLLTEARSRRPWGACSWRRSRSSRRAGRRLR